MPASFERVFNGLEVKFCESRIISLLELYRYEETYILSLPCSSLMNFLFRDKYSISSTFDFLPAQTVQRCDFPPDPDPNSGWCFMVRKPLGMGRLSWTRRSQSDGNGLRVTYITLDTVIRRGFPVPRRTGLLDFISYHMSVGHLCPHPNQKPLSFSSHSKKKRRRGKT